MTCTTVLLVTRDPSIVNHLRPTVDDLDDTQLEICGRLEKVPARLGQANVLLLIHDVASADPERIRGVLGAAERVYIRAAVVARPVGDHNPRSADLARYPRYTLPDDLPAVRDLIQEVQAESGRIRRGNLLSAEAADPVAGLFLGSGLGDQLGQMLRIARQATTVLLTGETGSGKTMLARAIHDASPRRGEPCLVVDCGALSGQLIESEMFGHARGAFTGADRDRVGKFAAAGAGTLVLDEVNSLPLALQAKLLRAVEDRVFEPVGSNKSEPLRARLVAISNVSLEDAVRREKFRADLFYRLNVMDFRIPPLRDRPGAVIPLAHQLLRSSANAACQGVTMISPPALEAMLGYQWPGNVRELRNAIERAAALAAGPAIQLGDLPESIRGRPGGPPPEPPPARPGECDAPDLGGANDEAVRILAVLRKHRNNRRAAADDLGLSRVSLYKKLHKYGLFVRKKTADRVGVCAAG